ncbi:hypothetical protein PUNSTDRAFT_113128 [Punctularia strigosozonata HHB-11173 SS5]|uniref:uncharacterized protein n=1 Tax=Punctularia strigosozonata (strain HHB-11173) TaxID=741275 RepID=UPI00044167E5|nr:uncharacterized protein PUNSTDRAFT_113128 [Punctularia strigosozonata HHB-11173 SS5]EIN09727.1 hypothetical protein PUNSTDRAFT_113128 [Punctularia strigosozonata HHB-11173 SS5]
MTSLKLCSATCLLTVTRIVTMPPRRQPSRQVQQTAAGIDPDLLTKRRKKHLDELERSNYSEPSAPYAALGLDDDDDDEGGGGRTAKSRARQTISDKRNWGRKKKSTMNVRTAILYKKNLATLIDESGIADLPPDVPTYLTAVVPPPPEPPRMICTVCGYWGAYKCKKCAEPYCDMNCESVHNETRCERRVI